MIDIFLVFANILAALVSVAGFFYLVLVAFPWLINKHAELQNQKRGELLNQGFKSIGEAVPHLERGGKATVDFAAMVADTATTEFVMCDHCPGVNNPKSLCVADQKCFMLNGLVTMPKILVPGEPTNPDPIPMPKPNPHPTPAENVIFKFQVWQGLLFIIAISVVIGLLIVATG